MAVGAASGKANFQIDTFQVQPSLPEELKGLSEMAYNMVWAWDEPLREVFRRLDRDLWEETYHNPVLMLGTIAQERLRAAARDDSYLAFYYRAYEKFTTYMKEPTWWDKMHGQERPIIAYFSAEYGIAESLPIYSGGLGVLSGDHLKTSSDLGIPLIGVGLLYQQGYFRQYLTPDGWQQELYPANDFYNLPVQPVLKPDGKPLLVDITLAGVPIKIKVWKVQVGRVPLYLMDTNIPENPREAQDITDQLYGGDRETRIRQEIVLGMGGLRALHALGIRPGVCHMNEGHSAFLALERIRLFMEEHGVSFQEALEAVRAGAVFTTHTPVPAGFDLFPPDMMDKYFGDYLRTVRISRDELLGLGRGNPFDHQEAFNMAVLALRTSSYANGVSKLHGKVSRTLFQKYLPHVPEHEVPITSITNGVHLRSWISNEMASLFDRYLGPEWWSRPSDYGAWEKVSEIPDEELWATHERRRQRMISIVRRRLVAQMERRGSPQAELHKARGVLDTNTLTIGFARRFATYKRGTLLLRDMERIKKILLHATMPVQIIFAGKAHPKDTEGKEFIKKLFISCLQEDLRRHIVFVEDYDIQVARYLVHGVDVWLNNPRRPYEASGTSGMKVLANGGLNMSILDGWWVEGYRPETGWAIGAGEEYDDQNYQDYVESNAIYNLLENEVVPLFYRRDEDGLPRGWIAKVKNSMRLLCPAFSCTRMLNEYAEQFYLPVSRFYARMTANSLERAKQLARWKQSLQNNWPQVRIEGLAARDGAPCVGQGLEVRARVRLGAIEPKDVSVELYFGPLNAERQITDPRSVPMKWQGNEDGVHNYVGVIPCERSGLHGYTVRAVPAHPDAVQIATTGLITWR
jgi:starch phosphorylase